jgi:hypothetical protein
VPRLKLRPEWSFRDSLSVARAARARVANFTTLSVTDPNASVCQPVILCELREASVRATAPMSGLFIGIYPMG